MGHAYGRARGFGIIRAGSTDLSQEQDPQRRGHRHHRRCDRSLGDGDCGQYNRHTVLRAHDHRTGRGIDRAGASAVQRVEIHHPWRGHLPDLQADLQPVEPLSLVHHIDSAY
ncbi:Uncharacterised protein [Chlamydia trachomatis]|nr:Uncharacterised protein [Chlamydia trachomatis]